MFVCFSLFFLVSILLLYGEIKMYIGMTKVSGLLFLVHSVHVTKPLSVVVLAFDLH